MKYFVDNKTGEIHGYDSVEQKDLIATATKSKSMKALNTLPSSNEVWDAASKTFKLDLSKAVADAKTRISSNYEAAIASMTAGYTEAEQKTWATQLAQAKAFTANTSAVTPALDALVAARGSTKAIVAPLIIQKAEALELASLGMTGKYQKLIADIDALALKQKTTQKQLDAIVW